MYILVLGDIRNIRRYGICIKHLGITVLSLLTINTLLPGVVTCAVYTLLPLLAYTAGGDDDYRFMAISASQYINSHIECEVKSC